jgi:hypothetical protein
MLRQRYQPNNWPADVNPNETTEKSFFQALILKIFLSTTLSTKKMGKSA